MAPAIINKILGKTEEKSNSPSTTSAAREAREEVNSSSTGTTGTHSHGSHSHGSHSHSSATGTSGTTSGLSGEEKYETTHQTLAPAVEHERVVNAQAEEVQTVVDRERHQDHYHTTVQPLKDQEIRPEEHIHRTAETEVREFDREDSSRTREALAAEQAKFKSTRTETAAEPTIAQGKTLVSENVHHHLHETVQPVIEKETIAPTVVHTTIPIKETHHEAPHIHSTTVAPTLSINEFEKTAGQSISGSTGHSHSSTGHSHSSTTGQSGTGSATGSSERY